MSSYWKKKMEELEQEKNAPSLSYWEKKTAELEDEKKTVVNVRSKKDDDDIAPIKSTKDDGKLDFFQKGAFEDGYQVGDITKTILGTVGDAGLNAVKGAASLGEGLGDLINYGIAGAADAIGKDDFADRLRKNAKENAIDKLMKPAEDYLDRSSILGRTSDSILQGVGQVGGIMATGGLGAAAGLGAGGVTALTTGVMGLSGMGSGMSEAYQSGATDGEATLYGAISGTADAISELIFGGLGKAVNAVGFSRGLSSADDMLAKKVSSMFSNQIMKNFSEFGIKAGAEGLEEVLAGIAQAAGKKATYMSEEEFGKILKDENLLEQFVVGAVTSGIAQTPGLHIANKTGTDFITGLNQNEQAVVKKEIENRIAEAEADGKKLTAREKAAIEAQVEKDLEKGYISTDLIDEVVGGETYKAYKDSVDQEDALFNEYEELGKATNPTLAQQYRYRELDSRVKSIKDNDLRSKRKEHLDQFVSEQVNGSRLAESYNERVRRGQAFEADLSKYDVKQQAVIQKAAQSGILNNTNRTHEFVDMIAKISADKGVLFDFTNNQKLNESGFAVDGKFVNGYWDKKSGTIGVNVSSAKALNTIVGHEITHVLEGTDIYNDFQKIVVEYAKAKGDYQGRMDALSKLYDAKDVPSELTADLVGDYLFTDQDFINNLSVNNRNVFQKIYDEVKYLLKVATAGSKEARELEKAKRTFEKAYRQAANAQTDADADVKYSLRKEAPPKKTQKAYKLMRLQDGKLYPLFIGNNEEIAVDTWYNADSPNLSQLKDLEPGTHLVDMETGEAMTWDEYAEQYLPKKDGKPARSKPNKADVHWANDNGYRFMHIEDKAGGKSEGTMLKQYGDTRAYYNWGVNGSSKSKTGEGTASLYALRPGWHFGELPTMHQIGYGGKTEDTFRLDNQVWVEVDMAADVDYNAEAEANWGGDIPTHIPTDGYYKFATNPTQKKTKGGDTANDATKGDWYVAGAFKVNRILSDTEADAIIEQYNRETGKNIPLDYRRKGGRKFNAETMSVEDVKYSLSAEQQEFFKDSVVRDENGNLKVMYHGTSKGGFNVFDTYGSNYGLFGTGSYFTDSKTIGESYTKKGKGKNPQVYEAYLNIKNPLDMDAAADPAQWAKAFPDADFPESGTNEQFYRAVEEFYADQWMSKWEVAEEIQAGIESGMGYDGITHIGGGRVNPNGERHQVYIAFQPEQIKSVDNTKPTGNPDIRYSLSDSNGKELSAAQSEYFKDSKVRDENGNLMVMYHGTPNGDFTVFKDGTYFTPSKEYADRYQNPSASMLRSNKVVSNPKTFEVYLDIKKPFDISDAEARSIYINDYIKGGNAVGINPYLSDAEYAKINAIDWTEGEDLRDFLIENEYDYDGLVLDEGGTGGYGDEVQSRGKSYVVFSPEQVKNIDNQNPTSDPDIRFSLSEAVEETKDLMALHNLTEQKLLKSLKLGGLPMPSVAIAKAKDGHGEFGEISLILPKETIDPKSSSRNKLYSGDAWTPTYPKVDYKPSRKVLQEADDRISGLVPYEVQHVLGSLMFDTDNVTDALDRYNGNMVEAYKNNDAMKYAYLKDTGSDISLPMKEADLIRYGTNSNAAVRYFSGKLVNGLQTVELYQNMSARDMLQDKALTEAVADAQNFDVLRTLEPGSVEYLEYERNPVFRADEVSFRDINNFLSAARKLLTNGIQQTVDRNAAKELIRNKVDQSAYESWLEKLFAGVVEKEGIRNNKDYFTPSGNRRSFEALHYEHNLENVIKAMREKGEKGIGNGFGGASIFGASTTEFSSIEEMKQSSDRLQTMSYDEYQELRKGFTDRFLDIAMSLPNQRNSFSATDSAAEVLTEAVAKYKTRSGIANYLRRELKGWATYSDQVVDDLIELVNDIRKMPTGYFEAKPQRAVGFDEVGVFVIPNDADVKLKQELLNRGYSIAEYDPKVEGDRQRVVNQFEEFKFSLADAGAAPKTYGRYNVYGKDIALSDALVQEEVAPVAENATTEVNNATPNATSVLPNATVSEMESVAPVPEPVSETDMFPDDLAPLESEIESLLDEKAAVEVKLFGMSEAGEFGEEFNSLSAKWGELDSRIKELQAQSDERLYSLGDADVPPEVEAPYPGEPSTESVSDPFADRDMHEVGKRNVKAYQFENPEVKPFFLDAAYGMLDDIRRGTKGEKIFNEDVYYQSGGEHGWMGTKRQTTSDIAELLDQWHYTYAEIEEGLNDIIEDHGKENNAVSKRIEFMLDDRLRNGYTDVWGEQIPPNQEYINLLREKQITEYSKEAFDSLFANADDFAPLAEEEDIAPVVKKADKAYEAIRPQPKKKVLPAPAADDIAPVYGDKLVRVDSNNGRPGEKQRKWVGTSTESEAVNRQVLPDDLDQDKIHYQPISNKVTLNKANAKLDGMGYESSVTYFNSQFTNKSVSLEDVALGERLIQEAIKRGDTKTAGELIQNVAILGTELGQKVQALSMIQRMTPEGQLKMLQKTVERGKAKGDKAYDGVVVTQEMIDKILSAYGKDGSYDQVYLGRMVEDVKKQIADQMKVTALDKVNAWRYLSMLGNPKTHIRNLVSNVAMRGTVAVKDVLARTIETAAPIQNRTKTWQKPTEFVKSYAQKTAAEMKDIISDGGKYSEDSSIKQKRDIFRNRILNGLYEFNSDMLTKEDWWFSKTAFTNALSEYLTANGIRTHEDLKKHPKIVEKARVYATEQSQIATFRQYSWLANKINDIERHNAATDIAVGAIMPFKKTPINIAKTGLNYSPLGFAKTLTSDVSKVKKGDMEASELIDHLSQNITGSALTLVGYMLASSGFLSGAGEDDKEGEYDYQLGEQAYAINIGGKSYSLSWLSPIAMPLFVGANAYEQLVEGKEWNGDVVVETLAQTLDPLSEMSFLSGLDSVLSSYDSGIQKFAGIAQTMAQNYATQFVPTLSSQVATVLDDTKRSTKVGADSDFKFVDQTINKLKYKIPFLRETLEPSTDIWGNNVKQTENVIARAVETFLAPYAAKGSTATAVDEEIKALYRETGEDSIIPGIPNSSVTYKDQKYAMSAKEYTAYKKTYGQTAFGLLEELFRTGTYQNADASEKADMIDKVYDYARDVAKQEFLAGHGVEYTNATSEGEGIYKDDAILGAIRADMPVDEYKFFEKDPEKYALLEQIGITYETYRNADDEAKDAYSWALENPDKYPMSKAVASDVVEYRRYASELYDIKADKDSSGKSISGSRKEKVLDYINGLDIDYGAKLILFKSEYNADDESNYEIIDYLNSRSDISYEEMITILKELDFTIGEDGVTIYWD